MNFSKDLETAKAIGKQDWNRLIDIQNDLIKSDGENIYNLYWLSYGYEKLGKYKEAIQYSKKILKIDNHNFDAIKILSGIYNEKDELDLVYKYAKLGLQNLPRPSNPPVSKGFVKFLKWFSIIPLIKKIVTSMEYDLKISNRSEKKWELWAEEYIDWYDSKKKL